MTDANGNTATGTITVNIVDDVPTASADSGSVTEGARADGQRADRRTTTCWRRRRPTVPAAGCRRARAGGDTTTAVCGGVGTGIAGARHADAEGERQLHLRVNREHHPACGATDVFVYTIKDGDGDLSTTTLTINLTTPVWRRPNAM